MLPVSGLLPPHQQNKFPKQRSHLVLPLLTIFGDSLSSKGFHVYLLSVIEPAQTELRGKRVLLHGVKVTKHLDEHRPTLRIRCRSEPVFFLIRTEYSHEIRVRSGKSQHPSLRYGFSFLKAPWSKLEKVDREQNPTAYSGWEHPGDLGTNKSFNFKTRIMKGLLPPIINSLPLISLMQDPGKTQGIWKEKPKYRNVDIYKALSVKAPESSETTADTAPMQTAKSGAEITHPETRHCTWPTVDAQQTCAVWIVWMLNRELGTPRSSEWNC